MFSVIDRISSSLYNFLAAFLTWIFTLFGLNHEFLNSARLKGSVEYFFTDAIVIFLMLILIIFIVSIIRSFFPPEKTKKLLGDQGTAQGFIGNIVAALLGIVTPFCSCSAVPVFIGFIEAGIPLGVTFSFLISSPMVNEVALVMLWGLFGWKIALLYITTGVMVAIFTGFIIGKLKMESSLEDDVFNINVGDTEIVKPTWKQRISDAWSYDLNLLKKIWPYVVIGLAIGAAIHGWAPSAWLAKYAGKSNPFSVPIAVLIGIPLYSNAAGTLPIVSELTKLGVPIGTALSFMMAVTALSLPEMIILRKVLKPKLLAVFIGIMAITIIFIGYFFNIILT